MSLRANRLRFLALIVAIGLLHPLNKSNISFLGLLDRDTLVYNLLPRGLLGFSLLPSAERLSAFYCASREKDEGLHMSCAGSCGGTAAFLYIPSYQIGQELGRRKCPHRFRS